MPDAKTILLVGTLDTKGHEYAYLRNLIQRRGHRTLVMDASVFDSEATARAAQLSPDIDARQVALAGGSDLIALRTQG